MRMPLSGTIFSGRRAVGLLAAALLCLVLQGCLERDFPSGTVAVVDRDVISFEEMEAARSALFSGQAPHAAPQDDAVLHRQYRYVLQRLIEERIICRFMEKKGFALAPGALDAEEERIRADYPDGAFEQMLTDKGVVLEDWRQALRRRLLTEQFLDQVLRPEISISGEEVQEYYNAHSQEFLIPEQWHFLRVSGREQTVLEQALRRLTAGEEPAEVRKELLVTIHDVHMAVDLLPEDIRRALAPLLPVAASAVVREGDAFGSLVLLEKIPSALLDPAEISRRVEKVLSEEKMRAVHNRWLEKQSAKVKVRIAPALAGDFSAPEPVSPAAPSMGDSDMLPVAAPAAPAAQGGEALPVVTPEDSLADSPEKPEESPQKP